MLDQLGQLWRNKTAVVGLIIIIAFVVTAIFAPQLSPHDPVDASLTISSSRRSGMKPAPGNTSWAPTTWAVTSCPG